MIDNFLSEYIHGGKFESLALPENRISDIGDVPDNYGEKPGIIYCPTHFYKYAFAAIDNKPGPYVLITHNSDNEVTQGMINDKPKSIVAWFSQNVRISAPGLYPIPIGIERPHVGNSGDMGKLYSEWKNRGKRTGLLFCCFDFQTNIIERCNCYESFEHKKWCTRIGHWIPFEEHCKKLLSHRFVASPVGNGIDCIRTWEALYLGAIPVSIKGTGLDDFCDLPILRVQNWQSVDKRLLCECGINNRDNNKWLKFSTWKHRILEEAKRHGIDNHQNRGE